MGGVNGDVPVDLKRRPVRVKKAVKEEIPVEPVIQPEAEIVKEPVISELIKYSEEGSCHLDGL